MKIEVFCLLLLHLAHFSDAQCAVGWDDVGGQCMKCSNNITGGAPTGHTAAQTLCTGISGNLATVINTAQETYAYGCRGTIGPWIGYLHLPYQRFIDGTLLVTFNTLDVAGTVGPTPPSTCWFINVLGDWNEDSSCTSNPRAFACSRPYDSCDPLEVSGVTSVAYDPSDTSTLVNGKRWVGTTATYSCDTGYTISGGDNPRTCQDSGSWTGSAPQCVVASVCSALTTLSDSTLSYNTVASGSSYTTGTVATASCNSGYEMKSGSITRLCESSGAWTGANLECETATDDKTEELAIGLGVGLGLPLAMALAALLFFMCRSAPALPRSAPAPRPAAYPRPVAYPRPAFRPPYPRRMGPRPLF